jgi:hypothetical protein
LFIRSGFFFFHNDFNQTQEREVAHGNDANGDKTVKKAPNVDRLI